MSTEFELHAQSRSDIGKGASRRLRRLADQIPGVIYGGGHDPQPLTFDHKKVIKALENEAFYSHILTIHVDGKPEQAILKDIQRHPYKPKVLHMDFQRITGKETLHRNVTLHFLGGADCPAAKQGGVITHHMKDVEITCSVSNLPEYIEVDLANLEMDQVVHLSDLVLPKGVELVQLKQGEEHNLPVVAAHMPRAAVEATAEAEDTEAAADADESSDAAKED